MLDDKAPIVDWARGYYIFWVKPFQWIGCPVLGRGSKTAKLPSSDGVIPWFRRGVEMLTHSLKGYVPSKRIKAMPRGMAFMYCPRLWHFHHSYNPRLNYLLWLWIDQVSSAESKVGTPLVTTSPFTS